MSDRNYSPGSSGNGESNNGWGRPQPVTMAEEEGVDFLELTAVLWNGKWIIAGVTVVVLALALIYAFLSTPIYQANALIQIDQGQNQPAGADILSMLLPTAAPTQAEIAIMKSRSVLHPTVEKEHLNIVVSGGHLDYSGPAGDPNVTITNLVVPSSWMDKSLTLTVKGGGRYVLDTPDGGKLLAGKVGQPVDARNGAVKILVTRLDVPAGESFQVKRIYDQQAVNALQERFDATQQQSGYEDTGIVTLTLQGPHPARIKSVLNTIANQYIKQNVAAQAAQARQSLAFINQQLPKVKHTLDTAQSQLTQYRTEKGVVNLDAQAQSLLQSLTSLESQMTQVNLTRSSMQQRFTSSYPGLKALQAQRQDIQTQINAVKAQIENLPAKEKDYVSLLQKVQVYQQLYTALLSKSQDLEISQAATTGNARIVDYAVTPIRPIKPHKALIGILGIIVGLFLGIFIVFLRRALTRSVQDAGDLEAEFGLPVYAVVPHSNRQASLARKARHRSGGLIPVLAATNHDDPAVESIRSLRTSIVFLLKDTERKVITLGGSSPNIGKSFLSINLAHVLGSSGSRVLLVDADLRRGHLEKYMKGQKQPGLSQLLRGSTEPEKAIQRSPHHDNVDFLPSGPFPSNPYELMTNPRLEEAINGWAVAYDFVVIDVPPVLSVAEGLIIARLATANLFVAKAGMQTLREMRIALDRMQQNGVRLEGFIFNDLSRRASSYTYGYYANRYYYARAGKGDK